jgi:hypothetical protein
VIRTIRDFFVPELDFPPLSSPFPSDEYSQQPTSRPRQHQNALNNSGSKQNRFYRFFSIFSIYPLFGPFGATIGNTMPMTPKTAVKMRKGKAPIALDHT